MNGGSYADLAEAGAYMWWGASSLIWRVAIPLAIGVWVLGMRPTDLGLRLRGISAHLPAYGFMYLAMLPVLIWASGFRSFQDFYPFCHFPRPCRRRWPRILGYMALRSKSFVPGVFLHAGVAITMDMLVLARRGALGNIF